MKKKISSSNEHEAKKKIEKSEKINNKTVLELSYDRKKLFLSFHMENTFNHSFDKTKFRNTVIC